MRQKIYLIYVVANGSSIGKNYFCKKCQCLLQCKSWNMKTGVTTRMFFIYNIILQEVKYILKYFFFINEWQPCKQPPLLYKTLCYPTNIIPKAFIAKPNNTHTYTTNATTATVKLFNSLCTHHTGLLRRIIINFLRSPT